MKKKECGTRKKQKTNKQNKQTNKRKSKNGTYVVSRPSDNERPSGPRWFPCWTLPKHPDAALPFRRPFLLITITVAAPQRRSMTGIVTPAITVELSGSCCTTKNRLYLDTCKHLSKKYLPVITGALYKVSLYLSLAVKARILNLYAVPGLRGPLQ